MKKRSIKKKYKICISIIFIILIFMLFYFRNVKFDSYNVEENDIFSYILCSSDSGFYTDNIEIELTVNKKYSLSKETYILYTLNGDDPRENGTKYKGPIVIYSEETPQVIPLKATLFDGKKYSPVINKTFVIGHNISKRFTYPLISITTDNSNLYDNEKGIFIPGITYQNYLEMGGDPNLDMTLAPCNYNRRGDEWIRNAHIEVFSETGTLINTQSIGLGVAGSSSSGQSLKSLKLVANNIYDTKTDKFYGNFWKEHSKVTNYSHVNKFNKILLKSGGQDFNETQLKWDIISKLAEQSGFYPIAGSKKVLVYLNGAYYGLMSMSDDYSSYNIAQACGLDKERIEIINDSESICLKEFSDLFKKDLDNAENRKKLEEKIDIDNFLLYYTIQIMINNVDWPYNNYIIWRYNASPVNGNIYSDGRLRFLLNDVDLAYLPDQHWRQEIFGTELFEYLMDEKNDSPFYYMMKSDYYKSRFLGLICNLNNLAFKESNIFKLIDNTYESIRTEAPFYEKNKYNMGDEWMDYFYSSLNKNIDDLKICVTNRIDNLVLVMQKYWGKLVFFRINIEIPDFCQILCNNICLAGDENGLFYGDYVRNSDIIITANIPNDFSFKHWIVNGIKISDEILKINDEMIKEDKIDILIVTEQNSSIDLCINEISARGSFDWIELYNGSTEEIVLSEYCLSDDSNNLKKYNLPEITLESQEYVVIYGKSNKELGQYVCNFNLKAGEELFLVRKNTEEIIEYIVIPWMMENESFGRNTPKSNFVFFAHPTKGLPNNSFINCAQYPQKKTPY